MTQLIPLDKRSKKAQREYYSKQRGSWYGVNPITRTVQSKRAHRLRNNGEWSGQSRNLSLPMVC